MHIEMTSLSSFRFLSLILLLLMIINPSQSHFSELNNGNDVVHVSLYYESLCPFSKDFILEVLEKFTKLDVMSIVNLHLVPYGNAFTSQNGTVSCQHGPDECYYNIIEACALEAWPLKYSLPFIFCVENGLFTNGNPSVWGSCCNRLRLDPRPIQNCYSSKHGNELHIRNGKETNDLNPPLTHVPWLLVNGQYVDAENDDLVNHVCNAYKGPLKFKACQKKEK
ncbi:gamma-interferon-responsive lysosomal thiol protein-like [Trifolium pratense]|uniref:gamma-interferon-responsive lysosomal thiol protein-like n=1 Tax=Trifolium pratense TaxID=57577 RepID=UPI001E693C95|nr:gamma-interferon-responsive lysosomal thiol protein-like [Trifolium pratense]XP_045833734.1 gamma-interferon-responsive lysosomal thiol protein-like [Trifolium pratense]